MKSKELERELLNYDFSCVGFATNPLLQGFLIFDRRTFNTNHRLLQLMFHGYINERERFYFCGYAYKKHLSEYDIQQLNHYEEQFQKIVEKHGYRKLIDSTWKTSLEI